MLLVAKCYAEYFSALSYEWPTLTGRYIPLEITKNLYLFYKNFMFRVFPWLIVGVNHILCFAIAKFVFTDIFYRNQKLKTDFFFLFLYCISHLWQTLSAITLSLNIFPFHTSRIMLCELGKFFCFLFYCATKNFLCSQEIFCKM